MKDIEGAIPAALHERVEEKGDNEKGTVVIELEDEVTYPDGGIRAWSVVLGGWMTSFCAFGVSVEVLGTRFHRLAC